MAVIKERATQMFPQWYTDQLYRNVGKHKVSILHLLILLQESVN